MTPDEFRQWWDRLASSHLLLGTMALLLVALAVLYQVGVLGNIINLVMRGLELSVRAGFHAWRRTLAWLPWPLLLLGVLAVNVGAAMVGGLVEAAAGLALLSAGVIACLAYIHLDTERDAVERGYKALHNPLKGQELAADLAAHSHRAGTPLLFIATFAVILGFALLNNGLYDTVGESWYRVSTEVRGKESADPAAPTRPADYFDFLAYTVLNFIRVVDLLDIANTYNRLKIDYVHQAKWPASTLLMLFRTFFTMVLLQQVMAAVRRGNLLGQCIADFWSPHGPIHDRAAMALRQQGVIAVRPLLRSLRTISYLTPEQRDELPRLLADIGPRAAPYLTRYLRDRDENLRLVAVSALGRLQALDALRRLERLADDPSDAVRLGLADTLAAITLPGAAHLAKQWRLRHPLLAKRPWYARLRELVPWLRIDPPNNVIVRAACRLLRDISPAVRGQACVALAQLGRAAASAESDLVERLRDADESVRARAIGTLASVAADDDRVAAALTPLLTDASPVIRAAAARALGSRGAAMATAASGLLPLLRDADAQVRSAAAAAVASIGLLTDEAHRELAAGLTSADNTVRAQTAEVMGSIKMTIAATLPALIEALKDDNDQVRVNAAEAIGNAGPDAAAAVDALAAALRDRENRVVALVARALGAIGPPAASAAPALVTMLGHINAEVRTRTAEAIGRIGKATEETLAALRRAAADPEGAVRAAALESFARIVAPPVSRDLLLAALADSDPRVRAAAVNALAPSAGEPGVGDAIITAAADGSDSVKERVAAAIGEAGIAAPKALQALARMLGDDTAAVQIAAAQALGKIGPAAAPAAETLAQLLRTGDVALRRQVLRSLALIDPAALLPFAATALNDDDAEVRKFTSAAMLKAPHLTESLVVALIAALRDPEVQVRSNAAAVLGRLPELPETAVASLAENLANTDDGLRLTVARTLAAADDDAIARVFPPLLLDTNANVRLLAIRRLLAIDPDHADARAALAAELAAEAPAAREAAAEVARELGLTIEPEAVAAG